MKRVIVTADSTCDLSPELLARYGVATAPLYIVKGETSYRDGVDITPKDIFAYFEESGKVPTTAAVSVADYHAFFSRFVEDGCEVVHINISSGFSSCFQNACIVAAELEGVYPVDSLNLSTGSGLTVIRACELAKEGKTGAEIASELQSYVQRVEASFVIDTLTYLHKGGRCSSVAALGANLLGLKPCIQVEDGKMHVGKKYRGKLGDCILRYVEDRLKGRDDVDKERIFITHSGCSPEVVRSVQKKLEELGPFGEVLETVAGCTISNHCGPGTLGILFVKK